MNNNEQISEIFDDTYESETRRRAKIKLRRDIGTDFFNKYQDDLLIEVMANPASSGGVSIFWEKVGEPMVYDEKLSKHFTPMRVDSIIRTVAGFHNLEITQDNPILECTFPLDGSRFTAIFPPVVSSASFTIRKKPNKIFTLDEYVSSEYMTETQKLAICDAVKKHKNIIVVGGTSSGKTTLVNAVILEMTEQFPAERIYISEDTGEIQCKSKNIVQCYTTTTIDLTKIVKTSLRYRPDRILVGELRGAEALDLLDAWNTGHPGGVCTVHANSAKSGLSRIQGLVSRNPSCPDDRNTLRLIAEAIHILVYIRRDAVKKRVVEEVCEVVGINENGVIEVKQIA